MYKLVVIFCIIFLNISLNLFSQTVQIISQNNFKNIIQTRNSETNAAVPVSHLFNSSKIQNQNITNDNISLYNWSLKFTASGKVFKDVYFVNPQVGYIVTELGSVYKTTNSGNNWTSVMNLGFPYYWYGVFAVSPDTVIISGFNNQGNIHSGVVRWSYNGGTSWTGDINLYIPNGVGWLDKVHFFNQNTGITFAGTSGACHYTTNGGKDSTGWTYIQINSDLAWFSGTVDFKSSGNIFATGIHFASSSNFGVNWSTFPSADNVFDGGVSFLNYNLNFGWTGGGSISPTVSGWVHRTTDGGTSWSTRLNTFNYPIRALQFFNTNTGIISGGNVYSEAGGIYTTVDGGSNWNLDVNTAAEMFSINTVNVGSDSTDVWCVGSTGGSTGFNGKAYKTRIGNPTTNVQNISTGIPENYKLFQNYPNPFNPSTIINYSIPNKGHVSLTIYDDLGRDIITLVNEIKNAGNYLVEFNGSELPSGVYFYRIQSGNFTKVKKMMLIK